MPRIGIDVRYLSHGLVGGVHTYVRNLVPALIDAAPDSQFVLYADTKSPFELQDVPGHATVRLLPWRNALSTIQHDLLAARQMEDDRLDVIHFPANYGRGPFGVPLVVTIHDAINLLPLREIVRGHPKRPGTIAKMTYLHYWTTYTARRANVILTVSEHAGREIAMHGHQPSAKIVPIPHAPTSDLRHITDVAARTAVRERFALDRPFVLADALKNPATLIRAWDLLPRSLQAENQIVFFSRRPDVSDVVRDAQARGIARLLIQPTRDELIVLYNTAEAFVFPSWIEGFGLPILEAMTCGAPVIASNRGAIPEVAGDAALLADAEDAFTFARHIRLMLTQPNERQRLVNLGFKRAREFSWANTARRTLECYERAIDARSPASGAPTHPARVTAGAR
jgi:glycosyltransferase involved in cell wall biosynthesis